MPSLTGDLSRIRDRPRPLTLNATVSIDYSDAPPIGSYSLFLIPGRYLPDLRISIWAYTGPIGDATLSAINQLGAKIDGL